mmetsp:Transcript_334/g.679  ORF Transcript_334/g.679 Transcript_334/m.679 type:complete len:81 (-) Transcript_334:208-450(-)
MATPVMCTCRLHLFEAMRMLTPTNPMLHASMIADFCMPSAVLAAAAAAALHNGPSSAAACVAAATAKGSLNVLACPAAAT